MSITRALILLFAVVLTSAEVVRAAAFPVLSPSVYVGQNVHDSGTYVFELRLQRGQSFVLRESRSLGKDQTVYALHTGTWRQIREGAILQLSNQSGFYRALNVGGTGNLYFDWPLPGAVYLPLALRAETDREPFPYPVSGVLRFKQQEATLEEQDSCLLYRVRGTALAALQKQYGSKPIFVELLVSESDELAQRVGECPTLHLEQIKTMTEVLPPRTQSTPNLFRDVVAGQIWEQHRPTGNCRFTFTPGKDTRTGTLLIADGQRQLHLGYELSETGLVFAAKDVKAVRTTGDAALAETLAQVRTWRVDVDVLELRSDTHVLELLEKRMI